jgi:hypothetical protein
VDGELPATQRAGLGGKITVGQIEVHPLEITKRPLRIVTEPIRGPIRDEFTKSSALVLKLSITNHSDLSLYPMDPAFTRTSVGDNQPITRLVANKMVFAGGPFPWPPGNEVKKKYEGQQANDYVVLQPGENREYVVCTEAKPEIIRTVENAKEPLQWRVQIRRDPITRNGKEVPVTAVIGVDFLPTEIKEIERKQD